MRILYLARYADATAYFRCEMPAKYLAMHGCETRYDYIQHIEKLPGSGYKKEDIHWADVIVFQRPIGEIEIQLLEYIKFNLKDKIIIGEYDDNYRDVPTWNPGYTYLKSKEHLWHQCIKYYDGCTVSTEPLKKLISEYNPNIPVQVVKNAMDIKLLDSLGPLEDHEFINPGLNDDLQDVVNFKLNLKQFNDYVKDKTVVAWFGSRTHYCDLDWLPDELEMVAEKYPDTVFLFVGYTLWRMMLKIPNERLFFCFGKFPVHDYHRLLKSVKIDVSLSPVDPNKFNLCKSGLKVFEAQYFGFVPVASAFDTYEADPFFGYSAGYSYKDWFESISEAIESVKAGKNKEILENNNKIIRELYDIDNRSLEYLSFYKKIKDIKENKNV